MPKTEISNSNALSELLFVPSPIEPNPDSIVESASNGVFIGFTKIYHLPFFVNFEALINPHIFITGMTGGGKTFLARSLMLRLHSILDALVIVIDFTGEYREFGRAFGRQGEKNEDVVALIQCGKSGILYFDLRRLSEAEKIARAVSLLDSVASTMRARDTSNYKNRIFVVLDEAWKLVKESSSLEVIIREGRKYGVGIVIASQLIEDIDAPFLANIATLFIFRIQNNEILEKISKNYDLRQFQIDGIQSLDVGACMLIQLYKSKAADAFFIDRVIGCRTEENIKIALSDSMNVEVNFSKLETAVKNICPGTSSSEILVKVKENGVIQLDLLISELISSGARRKSILSALRSLGVDDFDIADAFSSAIAKMGNEIEG